MGGKRQPKLRRPSFCKTEFSGESKSLPGISAVVTPNSRHSSYRETLWKPRDATSHEREYRNSSNVIDRKSIYAIKREHIAGRELSFLSRPPSGQHDSSSLNIEHLVEKNYIINSRLSNATPEKFPKVILRHFHRVSGKNKDIQYGMPRPPTRETNPIKLIMENIRREPSIVRIDQYPSLQEPVQCQETDEFCEILGPSSCQVCIECTNRHIGEELQHMVFPTIDITPDKLIYPKMAQVLTDGHRLQVRRRRMRELGIDMPHELINFPRQKSHLSSSTCLTCKKPFVTIMPTIRTDDPLDDKPSSKLRKPIQTARI